VTEAPNLKPCELYAVRYVPDLVRGEALNIGLLLHCPALRFLGCAFVEDFRRVRYFDPQADLRLLKELQPHFEQEIDENEENLDGYLRTLQDSLSNCIQLSDPQPCLLRDPQAEMPALLARYAGRRASPVPPKVNRLYLKQRLKSALVAGDVWDRLEKRVRAEQWTQRGDPFAFDYGYKPNGVIKLVHALSLRHDNELATVLKDRIQKVRRRTEAVLTAVVEDLSEPDDAALATYAILDEAKIHVQTVAAIDAFVAGIRQEVRT
jgi:Protein of unknown function (DUF3037)